MPRGIYKRKEPVVKKTKVRTPVPRRAPKAKQRPVSRALKKARKAMGGKEVRIGLGVGVSPAHFEISNDAKVNPKHYIGNDGSEVIDAIENFGLQNNMYRGQAIQYMFRAGRKDPETVVEDLLKAIWFAKREIADIQRRKPL